MLFNGWPLSLSPLRSCMDASVDKCFPFLCWLVCSQDQGTCKEKDDKNHGQQSHEEAGDEGFALVAWPLFSLSLSVVTLCSMVLCFRSSFFGSNCFCLPCSLSLVHLPGHFLVVVVVITANSPPSPTRPMASQWSDWTIFFFFFFLLFLLNR